jgi:hypothetical protein
MPETAQILPPAPQKLRLQKMNRKQFKYCVWAFPAMGSSSSTPAPAPLGHGLVPEGVFGNVTQHVDNMYRTAGAALHAGLQHDRAAVSVFPQADDVHLPSCRLVRRGRWMLGDIHGDGSRIAGVLDT